VRGLPTKSRDHNPSPHPSPYGRGSRPSPRRLQLHQFTPWCVRVATLLFVSSASVALAQTDVEDFYRGRQVNLIVGYGPGGGYDGLARLLARHVGRYIPGNPSVVVQNMPGAGSLRAANYLYSVAPKDGATFALFGSDIALIGLIANNPSVQFDPRRFTWLGSSSSFAGDAFILMVRPDAAAKSVAEARRAGGPPLVLAGTGEGARDADVPKILRDALGLNIKQVLGYPDTPSIFLAVERGEVDGRTFDFSSVKANKPQWLEPTSGFHILLQFARATRHKELPDVPTARELAPNDASRALIEFAEAPLLTMARPFAAPPGVPGERARALQAAFLAAHGDARFRAEAERLGLDISPVGAAEMIRGIEQIARASPDTFDYMKKLMASHRGG
jgi:tripartite-type tricarboxylate transporter receptor subunit TctC